MPEVARSVAYCIGAANVKLPSKSNGWVTAECQQPTLLKLAMGPSLTTSNNTHDMKAGLPAKAHQQVTRSGDISTKSSGAIMCDRLEA